MSSSGSGGYGSYGGPVMYYGVIIHDAIKRGDNAEMKRILAEAKNAQEAQGDLAKAIKELEDALAGK